MRRWETSRACCADRSCRCQSCAGPANSSQGRRRCALRVALSCLLARCSQFTTWDLLGHGRQRSAFPLPDTAQLTRLRPSAETAAWIGSAVVLAACATSLIMRRHTDRRSCRRQRLTTAGFSALSPSQTSRGGAPSPAHHSAHHVAENLGRAAALCSPRFNREEKKSVAGGVCRSR